MTYDPHTTQEEQFGHDLDEAARFISFFPGSICFQTFDDRGKDSRLVRVLHGTLDEHASLLCKLNDRGAGIFMTVNEIAPGAPRTIENVIQVRALFADADKNLPEVEATIAATMPTPSIVVETSPGKAHFYWRCDDCPLEHFTKAQKELVALLRTDRNNCDLPRVARVPGFFHHKHRPFLTRLLRVS